MSAYQRWGLFLMLFAVLTRTAEVHVNGIFTAFLFGVGAAMLTSHDRVNRQ